jgi:MoaE-MoaD fusion protein
MTVTVLLFAALREKKGTDSLEVTIEEGETPYSLFDRLFADRPDPKWPGALLFAVDREYVDRNEPLEDGCEVAFVPPLGGGEGPDPRVSLHDSTLPSDEVIARVEGPDKGGLVVFTGVVRNHHDGRAVLHLEYEGFEPMALSEMSRICDAIRLRWPGVETAMGHRLGRLEIGDAAVTIACASGHRAEAFEACRFAIDTLKETVPIFKKEFYEDGSVWKGQRGG